MEATELVGRVIAQVREEWTHKTYSIYWQISASWLASFDHLLHF